MKVQNFNVTRWGSSAIWWIGTKEELDYFQKWVEKYVPKKYFFWYDRVGNPGEEFHDTHLSGNFDCNAWVFLCYHWTPVDAPAIGQVWEEKKNKYYPGEYPFNGEWDLKGHQLVQHDNSIINLAWAYLQKEARDDGKKTPELKDCLKFLYKQHRKLCDKLEKARKSKD